MWRDQYFEVRGQEVSATIDLSNDGRRLFYVGVEGDLVSQIVPSSDDTPLSQNEDDFRDEEGGGKGKGAAV